jgi:hypothetical protein
MNNIEKIDNKIKLLISQYNDGDLLYKFTNFYIKLEKISKLEKDKIRLTKLNKILNE